MKRPFGLLIVVMAVMSLVLATALAQPGDRDPTWGDQGMTHTSFGEGDDNSTANALMKDGKWVLSGWVNVYPGDFGAARYQADGQLDPTFGDGGKVVTSFTDDPELVDAAWSVGKRPNGGLFVAGETCDADYFICQLAVAAYLEDGSLDTSFDDDGLVITDPGTANTYAWPGRLIVHSDGSLIIGGVVFQDDDSVDQVLVRYHPDGSLDDSFGIDGIAITDLADVDNFIHDMLALADEKILATGAFGAFVDPTSNEHDAGYLARMNSDGSLDTTFGGGDGYVTWDNDGEATMGMISVITPDNHILVLGQKGTPDGTDCSLRRYDIDGNLDTAFGENGQVIIDSGQDDQCRELALTPDGKLAMAWAALPFEPDARDAPSPSRRSDAASRIKNIGARAAQEEGFESVLVRYNLDGTPDLTFGENGMRRYGSEGQFFQLAIQRDGKFLIGSDVVVDDYSAFGALRFLGDGPAAQVYAPVVLR